MNDERNPVSCHFSSVFVLPPPPLCRVKKMSAGDTEGKQEWFSVPVPPSSNTTLQVSDLSPATEYQFSILSQNKFGTGPFSEIVTTRTLGQYHLQIFSLELTFFVRENAGSSCRLCCNPYFLISG